MNTEITDVDLGKEHASEDGINWGTATAMALFHVGAIAALVTDCSITVERVAPSSLA